MADDADGQRTRSRRGGSLLRGGAALAALALVGAAAGVAWTAAEHRRITAPARAAALEVAALVAADDVRGVWDRLAPESAGRLRHGHDVLVRAVATYETERRTDPLVERVSRAMETEYGLPLAELAKTTAAELWERRVRQRLADDATRQAYLHASVDEALIEGDRAAVMCTLPDDRVQRLDLVLVDGAWRLEDFVPTRP